MFCRGNTHRLGTCRRNARVERRGIPEEITENENIPTSTSCATDNWHLALQHVPQNICTSQHVPQKIGTLHHVPQKIGTSITYATKDWHALLQHGATKIGMHFYNVCHPNLD